MKAQEINLSSFVPVSKRGGVSEPWAIYYVYGPNGNYIVRGLSSEVKEYIKKIGPCFYRYTFWQNGKSRGSWASNCKLYIKHESRENEGKKRSVFSFSMFTKDAKYKENFLVLRRMTHKWLPEFDEAAV